MDILQERPDIVIRILARPEQGSLSVAIAEATAVVLVMEQPALTAEMIRRAPSLRVACRCGAGYDNFDVEALTRRGIPLTTSGAANAATVAEHAVYFIFALAKRGPYFDRSVKRGNWKREFGSIELFGRTCLIVGFGRIGKEIGTRVAALGMRVLVFDPHCPKSTIDRSGYLSVPSLEVGLPEADFVVLACALTDQTRGLIDETNISRMKKSAFVVNIARGPVIDNDALRNALADGRIAGAGLDVLQTEPPSLDDPLLQMDQVILSPHIGSYIESAFDRIAIAAARMTLAGLDGRLSAEDVVNPEVFTHG